MHLNARRRLRELLLAIVEAVPVKNGKVDYYAEELTQRISEAGKFLGKVLKEWVAEFDADFALHNDLMSALDGRDLKGSTGILRDLMPAEVRDEIVDQLAIAWEQKARAEAKK